MVHDKETQEHMVILLKAFHMKQDPVKMADFMLKHSNSFKNRSVC